MFFINTDKTSFFLFSSFFLKLPEDIIYILQNKVELNQCLTNSVNYEHRTLNG